ncbi:MAG TPA: putative quinol monooxygenase [Casimicrobiaceae bacterium]|nr:putative quinol monooxygenase [Casimicrobiaceae bacterium]
MTGELTVVARLRAAPGKGDALAALLIEQCGVVRASEPGCLAYRLHRANDDPDLFLFYEAYVDDAAFDAHRRSPHVAAFRQRREAAALTAGGAEVTLFRALTA